MFMRLHTYAVYVKPDAENPLETAEFVREGFSLWAFLFTLLWAAFNGVWRLFVLLLVVYTVLAAASMEAWFAAAVLHVLQLLVRVWVGMDGTEWKIDDLKRRGYVLYTVVRGVDEEDATLRLIGGVSA